MGDQTVGAALWAAGVRSWRTTRGGAPRGLFCGIGVCYDCLATVDGVTGQRVCIRHPPAVDPVEGRFDVAVVGGGPAGLAAAATAARAGCRVVLVDEAAELGGQYWRGNPHGFAGFASTVDLAVHRITGPVWFVEPGFTLHCGDSTIRADRIVVATGAHDRALPFPGWELPGVVTPGAAQALLKGSGVPLGERVVVAGAGPFLLPVAVGLARAGVRVVGVFEAGNPAGYLHRLGTRKLREAAGYAAALARYRIPYRTGHAVIAAHGGSAVSSVDVARLDGDRAVRRVDCDAVAVGYGFTARLELPLALGCTTRMSDDGGLALIVDAAGRTSVPGVYAAGEVTGVGGADLAVVEGELAGTAIAIACGYPAPFAGRALDVRLRRRRRLRAFARAMHAAHRPPAGWPSFLDDRTLVCRCEEVPYQRVRHAVRELGATDARTVKLFARPGMGWCQGRVCGYPTACLTASLCDREPSQADLLALAHRPFATPVRLGTLAGDEA
jgi:NADPH-dependent 2,4-dienoyl-CoA reductase/sulfur reductase-like enzyme